MARTASLADLNRGWWFSATFTLTGFAEDSLEAR